jgi:hypothetical protein
VNFDSLVSSFDHFGYRDMIRAVKDAIQHLERAPTAAARSEFLGRARRLLGWLTTGIHPEALDDRDCRAYIRIAGTLVDRGEFSSSVLQHLCAISGDAGSATGDSSALEIRDDPPRRSRRSGRHSWRRAASLPRLRAGRA